jgi:Kinesin motor domain
MTGHRMRHRLAPAQPLDRNCRAVSRDQLALSRVLTELAAGATAAVASPLKPASARDSRLTQALLPLLAGNAYVTMVAAISPAPEDYLDTVNMLRLAARAQQIRTHVTRGAVLCQDLQMTPVWQALPAEVCDVSLSLSARSSCSACGWPRATPETVVCRLWTPAHTQLQLKASTPGLRKRD